MRIPLFETAKGKHIGLSQIGTAGIFLVAFAQSASVVAGPVSFDCDVPADKFSTVYEDVEGVPMISGTLSLVRTRSGEFHPFAGARLASNDEKESVGFQIVAEPSDSKVFNIVLNVKHNGEVRRGSVGKTERVADIPFSIAFNAEGKAVTSVNGKHFVVEARPINGGKAGLFCSTAQFKFSKVIITASTPFGDKPR